VTAILAHACGGGSHPARPGADAGGPAQPDLGSIVTGTALLAGDLDIAGVTTDDVIAVVDPRGGVLALPASGGPAQTVDPAGQLAKAVGPVIVSLHNTDLVSGIGNVTIWTAAHGAVPFINGATGAVAVSDDGTRILATGQTSSDATSTTLVLGGIDGTPGTTLFPIALGAGCGPAMLFTGGAFVVAGCPPPSTTATVWSIDPTTGTATTLLTSARAQLVAVPDAAGDVVLVDASGNALLAPAAGAPGRVVGSGVTQVALVPDGSAVLLLSGGTIVRVPTGAGDPLTLAPTGVIHISGVSPDGQQVLYQTTEGLAPGHGDLWVTTAGQAGPAASLSAGPDTTIFHAPFTDDSQWTLYFTGADLYGVGAFTVSSIAGGAPAVLGPGGWTVASAGGARVVFTDAYTPIAKRPGRGVLRVADLASGAPPAIVATHAGATFYLTHARDQVLFSFNDGGPQSGIYAAALP